MTTRLVKNNFARKIMLVGLAAVIITLGSVVRLVPSRHAPSSITEASLSPYYFDKFDRLARHGSYPPEDVWQSAPAVVQENSPPGLAYVSLFVFRFWQTIAPEINALQFANFFPIIAFLLWAVGVVVFFRLWLRKRIEIALLLITILAFAPVAVSLTSVASFTQETMGVFLLFLSAYLLFGIEKPPRWYAAATTLVVTFLVLTWQQFPVLYFGAVPILAMQLWRREFGATKRTIFILLAALFASELIVRLLVGNDYSPFAMLKEFVLGFWLSWQGNQDFLVAMVRSNWRPVSPTEFYQLYGPLTLLMLFIGIMIALKRPRQVQSLAALIFTIIALYSVSRLEKEKNLAFGLFLFPIMMGIENIFEWQQIVTKQTVQRTMGLSQQFIKKRKGLLIGLLFVVLASIGLRFFEYSPQGIALLTRHNPPQPEIAVATTNNSDGTTDVTIRLTNRGGATFFSEKLWFGLTSGLHIEVGLGDIVRFSASSPTSGHTWRHYAVYPFARWGDYYFVEVKFRQLRASEYGEVRMTVKPSDRGAERKPTVYFRGWMPETSCILDYKRLSSDDSRAVQLTESEGEACLYRTPANEDVAHPICPVRVTAARGRLQNFRCRVLQL